MHRSNVWRSRRFQQAAVAAFLLALLLLSLLIAMLTVTHFPLELWSAIGDPKAVAVRKA